MFFFFNISLEVCSEFLKSGCRDLSRKDHLKLCVQMMFSKEKKSVWSASDLSVRMPPKDKLIDFLDLALDLLDGFFLKCSVYIGLI